MSQANSIRLCDRIQHKVFMHVISHTFHLHVHRLINIMDLTYFRDKMSDERVVESAHHHTLVNVVYDITVYTQKPLLLGSKRQELRVSGYMRDLISHTYMHAHRPIITIGLTYFRDKMSD